MLLILAVALTAGAWVKGWGARALLPLGIGMLVAFALGATLGPAGVSAACGLFLLLDLLVIGILAMMAANAPQIPPRPVALPLRETPPAEQEVAL